MMKYKLLVSDFDNTLLSSDHTVSQHTLSKISEFTSLGGRFVICTGRMFASIRKEAKLLGLHGDVIAYNGGIMGDIDTGEVKYCSNIEKGVALEIVEYLENNGKIVHLYLDDKLYVKEKNPHTDYYCTACRVEANYVGSLVKYLQQTQSLPMKILILDAPDEIDRLNEILQQRAGGRYWVAKSAPFLLDIEGANTSKGITLKYVLDHYGIDASECVCFGDSPNDLSMLKVAGVSVAVDNATDEVKKVVDYITDSCDSDGVGKVIDKIIRGDFL